MKDLPLPSMEFGISLKSDSPEQTAAIGRFLGRTLAGGTTVALVGPLGAGKTHLTQGIAQGLGIEEPLASPTFLLHRMYEGRLLMHHFDFYRLDSEDDLESIGFYDFQAQAARALIVVEWAEKFPRSLETPLIEIQITPEPDGRRGLLVRGEGVNPSLGDQLAREFGAC